MTRLDCGCDFDSAFAIYGCLYCRNSRCQNHRDQPHFCPMCLGCGVRHGFPVHRWDPEHRKLITIEEAS